MNRAFKHTTQAMSLAASTDRDRSESTTGEAIDFNGRTDSSRRARCMLACTAALFTFMTTQFANAQMDFEREPINYHETESVNAVTILQEKLQSGELTLEYDSEFGYLPTILKELDISSDTQMLVFSKTSLQIRRINPRQPRALYFNDDTYVGWVRGGDVIEISTQDPELGAVFYSIRQAEQQSPTFVRDRGECLACHANSRTKDVPGHLMRSVFADDSGQPSYSAGTFTSDHCSPFSERWGGWYVTGTHGSLRHMGNAIAQGENEPSEIDRDRGANVLELDQFIDTSDYLEPSSDLVALMVHQHQTQMHNLITRASFESLSAISYDQIMNEALDRPATYQSDSTKRRIRRAGDELVEYMLYIDEFEFDEPIRGTSAFEERFESLGPFDVINRSLRDFNLQNRLFKYRCSYLIYSEAFDRMPIEMKTYVAHRLLSVLGLTLPEFDQESVLSFDETDLLKRTVAEQIPLDERQSIVQILAETKPDLFELVKVNPSTTLQVE